mgnify:CR=1 FL=1
MFTFKINILFTEQIDSIKSDLTKYLPHIKSSHRVEAMARALGFKSYAALKAQDLFWEPIETTVDWNAFKNYLLDKSFECNAKPLYLAMARAASRLILEMPALEPELTTDGIGVHRHSSFNHARYNMLSDEAVLGFLQAYNLVKKIDKTRTITNKRGSLELKRIVDQAGFTYPDGEISPPGPVYMGCLICGALHAGFWYKVSEAPESVHFNMLQKSIESLEKEYVAIKKAS